MSGTFPTSPKLRKLKITSFSPTFVSTTHSLKRQVRSRGCHRWKIEGELPTLTESQFRDFHGFIVAQRGQYETFTFNLPVIESARGSAPGTPLVKGADQTGRSVITDGWTASQTGILLRGDFIKFDGDNKVYMVTADADSDASGESTISIEPALFTSPADNAVITTDNISFTVSFVDDTQELDLKVGPFGTIKISMIEVP